MDIMIRLVLFWLRSTNRTFQTHLAQDLVTHNTDLGQVGHSNCFEWFLTLTAVTDDDDRRAANTVNQTRFTKTAEPVVFVHADFVVLSCVLSGCPRGRTNTIVLRTSAVRRAPAYLSYRSRAKIAQSTPLSFVSFEGATRGPAEQMSSVPLNRARARS